MKFGKYSWFVGVILGAWLIKVAWNDMREGPAFQLIGLMMILASVTMLGEAYRKEIVSDVKALLKDAERKPQD
jgi:hypothetical protein